MCEIMQLAAIYQIKVLELNSAIIKFSLVPTKMINGN